MFMELLSQVAISEIMLLFVLLFIVPILVILVLKLRACESFMANMSPEKKKPAETAEPVPAASARPPVPPDKFPYKVKQLLQSAERGCLASLHTVMGEGTSVYPKVALWSLVEPSESDPGYMERLTNKFFDFLLCDNLTGQPFSALAFEQTDREGKKALEEMKKICEAAGVHLILLPRRDQYDSALLRKIMELPEH